MVKERSLNFSGPWKGASFVSGHTGNSPPHARGGADLSRANKNEFGSNTGVIGSGYHLLPYFNFNSDMYINTDLMGHVCKKNSSYSNSNTFSI